MPVVSSRTFRSGNSDAVRLPREVTIGPDVEVTIARSGDILTIYPKKLSIPEMLRKLSELPAPSEVQKRDPIVPPKRRGL